MKYLVTKAVIYYDKGIDNKDSIIPNVIVDNTDVYKSELKQLIKCDRIYLSHEEVE